MKGKIEMEKDPKLERTPCGQGMTDYGLIRLDGTQNTRDQGGMETVTGQRVRAKKLIRSDKLDDLTENDIRILIDECDLRMIVDLRTDVEQKAAPDPLDRMPGVAYVSLPVLAGSAVGLTHEHSLRSLWGEFLKMKADPLGVVEKTYPLMLLGEAGVSAFTQFFEILLTQEEGAVLWHCSEGKDRTGIASLLILFALGVPFETIMEDYLATNIFARQKLKRIAHELEKVHLADKSDQALLALICAHKEYIDAAMKAVEDKYGSLDAYLIEALDVTDEKRQILADKYLF